MLISFTLTMPGVNSWDGKWSGAGRCYVRVRSFRQDPELRDYYHYNFGDGWAAGVRVERIDAGTARKLRAKSDGFAGYDWMIDSILQHGDIQVERRA